MSRDTETFITPIKMLYERAARNQGDIAFITADDKWTFERLAGEAQAIDL